MKLMLIPLIALELGLGACSQTFRPDPLPTGPCVVDEETRMRFIGQRYVSAMRDELTGRTRSPIVRVMRPGDVATMDLRQDRLNVNVAEDGRIEGLRCG